MEDEIHRLVAVRDAKFTNFLEVRRVEFFFLFNSDILFISVAVASLHPKFALLFSPAV